ncbi:MAG: chemotaxis protein CheW [Thermodesulfobacteriota bacterium]
MAKTAATLNQESSALQAQEGKYLTFNLDQEGYGIEILKVREIIGIMNITQIPQMPPYVKGLINLRGKVIPVIDLRLKFDLAGAAYNDRTCIIVVEVENNGGATLMGVVVDSVSEVLNINAEDIEPSPRFGTLVATDYIMGMAKTKGGLKTLLDLHRVLTTNELAALKELAT